MFGRGQVHTDDEICGMARSGQRALSFGCFVHRTHVHGAQFQICPFYRHYVNDGHRGEKLFGHGLPETRVAIAPPCSVQKQSVDVNAVFRGRTYYRVRVHYLKTNKIFGKY